MQRPLAQSQVLELLQLLLPLQALQLPLVRVLELLLQQPLPLVLLTLLASVRIFQAEEAAAVC